MVRKEKSSSSPSPYVEPQQHEVRDNPPPDANESHQPPHPVAASAEEGAVGGPPSPPSSKPGQLEDSDSCPEILWPQEMVPIYFTDMVLLPFVTIRLKFENEAFRLICQANTKFLRTCYRPSKTEAEPLTYGVILRLGQWKTNEIDAKADGRFQVTRWSPTEEQPPMNTFFKLAKVAMFQDELPRPLPLSETLLHDVHDTAHSFLKRLLTSKAIKKLGKGKKFERSVSSEWEILPDGPEWTWAYSSLFFKNDQNFKSELLSSNKLRKRLELIREKLDNAAVKHYDELPGEWILAMKKANSSGILGHTPNQAHLDKLSEYIKENEGDREQRNQEDKLWEQLVEEKLIIFFVYD